MNVGFYHERAAHWHAGGIATFVQEMASALAERHTVYLYSGRGEVTRTLRDSPVEVVEIPPVPFEPELDRLLGLAPVLSGQLRSKLLTFAGGVRDGTLRHVDEHVDVLLTHQWLDDVLLSNAVGVPVVYEFHGAESTGVGSKLRERASGSALHLANSEFTAAEIERKLDRTVDGVVSPGVDTDAFVPSAPPAFERDEFTILFVGRIHASKGIYDLVEAFASVPGSHLDVVGDGDVDGVRTAARRLGVTDDVTLHGVVPHDRLPEYYASADVVCLPTYYESFGMVVLEAMACGKPVVASNVGGIRGYATHERDSILVPRGDGDALVERLRELKGDPELRDRLGAEARSRAESNSWQAQAGKLAEFCERAASVDENAVR